MHFDSSRTDHGTAQAPVKGRQDKEGSVSLACTACGSTDLRWEALVHWNVERGAWDIVDLFEDVAYCDRCHGHHEVDDRLLDREPAALTAHCHDAGTACPCPSGSAHLACGACGSEDIVSTAMVRWNEAGQEFQVVGAVLESSYCDHCESMVKAVVCVDPDAFSCADRLQALKAPGYRVSHYAIDALRDEAAVAADGAPYNRKAAAI